MPFHWEDEDPEEREDQKDRDRGPGGGGPGGGGPQKIPTTTRHQREWAKGKLRAAYLAHLGREMTDEDFESWWSGEYGWGVAGIEGLQDWLRGIKHEGDRLAAGTQTVPPPPPDPPGVPLRTGQAPAGYDQDKWDDPDHHSTKYDTASFLYGITQSSEIKPIVEGAAFQARFPGATFDGGNRIDFGSNLEDGVPVGVINVLHSGGYIWWGLPPRADAGGVDPEEVDPEGVDPEEVDPEDGDTAPAPPWTQPPGSPLFNPPATQGPPGMVYGTGPGGGGGTMGSMITPYNPLATYSPVPYIPPAPFRPPAYQGATPFGQDPYAAADPFTGPTAEQMTADPGYQFRLRQGQEALERSGAARGVTNTGGTLRDILDYGQQAASQEYGNVFGRQRDVYDLNERNRFNAYQANYGNAMDAYAMNERNRAGAFATNVGTARDAYSMNVANRFQGYQTNELARWQENQEAEARRSGAYGTNLRAYESQQAQGLRAQGQGFDQSFRNWQEQYNQGRWNATDTFNRMRDLSTL